MSDEKESIRSIELSESEGKKNNQNAKTPESNAVIKEVNVNQKKEPKELTTDEPKSLGFKSRSTASIQREGRYVTVPGDHKPKKDGVLAKTAKTARRPCNFLCDLCDPLKHWYGQIFIALGIVLTVLLVIILLTLGHYWD